jgi:hypothetical protein
MFGAIAAAGATLVAIVGVVAIGMVAWVTVVGIKGSLFAALFGGTLGAALRRHGNWLARFLGGLFGGAIGGFFAIAAAEQALPGSTAWAIRGVFLGAAFGVPTAVLIASVVGTAANLMRRGR